MTSDSLICAVLTFVFNLYGMYLFHRSDIEEIYPPQPIFAPLLPETDRLSGRSQTGFWAGDPKDQPLVDTLQDSKSFIRREPEKISITESTHKSRTNRIRRGMMAGPIASTPQVMNF